MSETEEKVEGFKEEYQPPEGVKPLATFWRQASMGTYYWRLLIPARHLPGRVNQIRPEESRPSWLPEQILSEAERAIQDDPLLNRYATTVEPMGFEDAWDRQEGVAIWQFLGDLGRTRIAATIQSRGVPCFMELDDNYLIPPPDVPNLIPGVTKRKKSWHRTVVESWRPGGSGYSYQAHKAILPSIDGLIVSTDELANQYDGLVPGGIYVCPNSVDPDDWPEIERVDRRVTVGFAGSSSHFYDLTLIERALGWAAQNADLVNVGGAGRRWPWPHTIVKWTDDLDEYRKNLQQLDIGLCPLKRSAWHDAKSDIKAMELLMAGALPIVQADSPCFKDWVGIVPSASTPKQWLRALREVVGMDADERYAMWRRAYDFLLENKTIDKHIAKWRRAIQ